MKNMFLTTPADVRKKLKQAAAVPDNRRAEAAESKIKARLRTTVTTLEAIAGVAQTVRAL
jgi:hypothetical protein